MGAGWRRRPAVRVRRGHAAPIDEMAYMSSGLGMSGEAPSTAGIRQQVLAEALANGQPLRYRDLVREQLHAWRARAAEQPVAGPATIAAPAMDADAAVAAGLGQVLGTSELLSVASLLQGEDPEPYARALAGEGERQLADVLRHRILSSLRDIGFDPAKTHFSSDEEDAIDLVGILFQSLFEANDLMQQAQGLYGRLVVPYLKVALTDDSLFNRRTHPARQLLDALTEACDGNTGKPRRTRKPCSAPNRPSIGRGIPDDQVIFELATAELRDQLDSSVVAPSL